MIKKTINNILNYNGDGDTLEQDTYDRKYNFKLYIFGIKLYEKGLDEIIYRDDLSEDFKAKKKGKIGFTSK